MANEIQHIESNEDFQRVCDIIEIHRSQALATDVVTSATGSNFPASGWKIPGHTTWQHSLDEYIDMIC